MIDVSQWRASIGLWYYKICDSSIDKPLLALVCIKGTRAAKKQAYRLYSEKHFQRFSSSKEVEQISSNEIAQSGRKWSRSKGKKKPVQSTSSEILVVDSTRIQIQSTSSQIPVPYSMCTSASTTMRYADLCGRLKTIYLAVFLFLLILSGDVELNPGPKTGNNYNT